MKFLNTSSFGRIVLTSCALSLVAPLTLFAAGPAPVDLMSAGNFAILAKSGISTTGTTAIVGDLGVSPAASTFITGFSLILPASSAFSTSSLVTGKVYAPDYATPTPTTLTTAVADMQTAYTNAAGRSNPTATELGAGNIGGLTITPGLYKWGTGVVIPADVTLSGSANDVWIFQIAQTLTVSSGVKVILSGGAQASNVFWIVGGQTTIGTTAAFNGTILDQTAIVLATGAKLNGRALAQTAVTLDSNAVTMTSASSTPTPVVTPTPTPTPTPVVTIITPQPTTNSTSTPTPTSTTQPTTVNANSSVSTTTRDCVGADMFSMTTGKLCSSVGVSQNTSVSYSAPMGQQVKVIATSMSVGARTSNVTVLQQFLISRNTGTASSALARVGATGYYGKLTKKALAEFQASVGISPASGKFGPMTRAYLSVHY